MKCSSFIILIIQSSVIIINPPACKVIQILRSVVEKLPLDSEGIGTSSKDLGVQHLLVKAKFFHV